MELTGQGERPAEASHNGQESASRYAHLEREHPGEIDGRQSEAG